MGADEHRFQLDILDHNEINDVLNDQNTILLDPEFQKNKINFYGISALDDGEQIASSKQSENLKKDIEQFRREKERSGSSDTY